MKIKQSFSLALATVALAGCGALESDPFANVQWNDYKELDGSTQQLSTIVFETVSIGNKQQKPVESVRILKRNLFSNLEGTVAEGYVIHTQDGQQAAIALLNGENSVTRDDPETKRKLKESKEVNFYEIRPGLISRAKFTAPNGVCQDLNKKGINVSLASTYYIDMKDRSEFYAQVIEGKLNAKEVKIDKVTPFFSSKNPTLVEQMKQDNTKHGTQLAGSNLQEKVSLFTHIICP